MKRAEWTVLGIVGGLLALFIAYRMTSTPDTHERVESIGAGEPDAGEVLAGETDDEAADEEVAHDTPSPTRAPRELVRESRSMMSTIYQMAVAADDTPAVHDAMRDALDEVERLGVVLSEWRDDSEVSAINRAAGHVPVHVGEDTMTNIDAGLEVARWTDGGYDITWAALRGFYLFQPGEERVPELRLVRERLALIDYHDVIVDHEASTVMLRREGMSLGLGGIAKGYAVDRAAAILEAAGFHDFMIFGGGQVLVRGLRDGRRWRVGIQHPRSDAYIGFLELTDCSIATSGDYEHSFIDEEGVRWHHIIDLHTGLPARETSSVTIIAPTGILADGFDTGCFVMGPEACLARIAELTERGEMPPIEAVILDEEMHLSMTPGTAEHVTLRMPVTDDGRILAP
jgi:thiamine biosynthesis lipoprotein